MALMIAATKFRKENRYRIGDWLVTKISSNNEKLPKINHYMKYQNLAKVIH